MTESLAQAIKVLKEGGLILYPTDTIWGIGCDATNAEAVAKVYALKQRDEAKSLVMLASDLDMVCRYVRQIPDIALQLVEVNDAPMTLIYPGAMGLASNAIAEYGSVGIRITMSQWLTECVHRFGRPLVSTSANISGEPSPGNFAEISQAIKDGVDYIVDPSLEKESTSKSSQIINVGLDGEVKIIRA